VTIILVPYHQDDQLPADDIAAPADVLVHPPFPAPAPPAATPAALASPVAVPASLASPAAVPASPAAISVSPASPASPAVVPDSPGAAFASPGVASPASSAATPAFAGAVAAGVERSGPPAEGRWDRLAVEYEAVAVAVAAAEELPLVFSGDCLIAGGVVAGVQRRGADPAIVWFDAHADLHTLESSASGYLGGMSLRLVTGAHPDEYANRFGLRPITPDRVVLADARDVDPPEADYLAGSAVRRIPVADVNADTAPAGPLVVHVDLDVIDAAEVPRLRFPVPDGPSTDDVLAACERLLATGRVVAVHVACPWWPATDETERAVRKALVARFTTLVAAHR
jgi:arginase